MTYSFDYRIAVVCGLPEAIIYSYVEARIVRCMVNGRNARNGEQYHDGCYWVPLSIQELYEEHPYLSKQQILDALGSLCSKDVDMLRTHRSSDGTLWFTLGEEKTEE